MLLLQLELAFHQIKTDRPFSYPPLFPLFQKSFSQFSLLYYIHHISTVPPKLPMDTPKIITQSPESIWFSWIPARIPAYATQTPITYVIEVKEPPGTSWKRAHDGLLDCQFTYEGMNPTRDYHIRVKAETQFGPSEPTLPIFIKRSGE